MKNRLFTMLWIGGDLNPLAVVSIKSFLAHGHRIQLFAYDKITNIPEGTIERDGSDIVLYEEMKNWSHDPAKFSDYFRYCLLHKEGGFWLDADFICISEEVPYEEFYWAQSDQGAIMGGALALPKGHELTKLLTYFSQDPRLSTPFNYSYSDFRQSLVHRMLTREEAIKESPLWINGPNYLEAAIKHYNYGYLTRSMAEIYPVPWGVWTWLYDDENITLNHRIFYNTWAIHCWNAMVENDKGIELFSRKGIVPQLMKHYLNHSTPYASLKN